MTNPHKMKSEYAVNIARMRTQHTRGIGCLRSALLGALALALAGCNGGTVDKHALQRDAEKIASLATEGELLANDVSKGASTKVYARVHAKELSEAASNLEDALAERPTSTGIEPDVRKASEVAGRVAAALEQLHLHPSDRGVSSLLGREVETESGRRIGRCHDLRAELGGSRLVVTQLVVGLGGSAERLGLGGRESKPCHVPWEAVVRIDGDRFVVRDGTELE